YGFVDEMSNWYVRRGRERFWAKGMEQDKIDAYMSLHTALITLCKCAAPMVPFMTEQIYRNMVAGLDSSAPESIHLTDFPKADERLIDKDLEKGMAEAMKLVTMGRAARNASGLKNRQPLSRMIVSLQDAGENILSKMLSQKDSAQSDFANEAESASGILAIIRDELNVKAVEFTADASALESHSFKPQLKTLGPKYGKKLGKIREILTGFTLEQAAVAWKELQENGCVKLNLTNGGLLLSGEEPGSADIVALETDDLLIETGQAEGYAVESDQSALVALDTTLTQELLEEGIMNELISKLQNMRKDSGLEVMDKIRVSIGGSDKIQGIAEKFAAPISGKVLAEEFRTDGSAFAESHEKEWDFDGEKVRIAIKKI
ncbi:MAG: class I tRNA ligase family protein, partial [Lachnospiraceae bacterium]|nr:class I tRNA ligase family protein [Lachnospiraceae bacterium]